MILENKRHLCLCAAAFIFGIILSEKPGKIWIFLCVLLSAALIYALNTCKNKREALAVGCVLAVIAIVSFFFCSRQEHQYQKIIGQFESGARVQVSGIVCQKETKTNSYLYYLKHTFYTIDDQIYYGGRILLYDDSGQIPIGSAICAGGKAENFEGAANEGDFDAAEYYRLQNITFCVYADWTELTAKPHMLWREQLYRFQSRVSDVFTQELNERDAGILCTLVLGNKSQLDAEIRQMYQGSGISHILAISGLHISILGFGIYRFFRKIRCSYLTAAVISSVIVCGFALMSGFGISTRRAVIMYLFMMGARVLGRTYDSANALAAAALVILIQNPLALFQSGFLFSFTALLSITLSMPFFQAKSEGKNDRRSAFREICVNRFFISAAIQLWLMPLTAWFYYEVPVYALFLNLLVIPLCSWLLGFGILGGLAGMAFPVLSKWLLVVCHLILDIYEHAIDAAGFLPGSNFITGKPPAWILVCYYLLLSGTCFLVWKKREMYRLFVPGHSKQTVCPAFSERNEKMKQCLVTGSVLAVLLLCLMFPKRGEFCIDFLDVGQGDGICISDGAGTHIFIDGGSSSENQVGTYRILPFLKYHQIRKIDAWIVTHGDDDHISGLLEVLEAGYPVRYLVLAEAVPRDDKWELLMSAAEKAGTEIVYVSAGDELGLENARMRCLYPLQDEICDDANGLSQVWALTANGLSVLLTGDIGAEQERLLLERKAVDDFVILKTAHHGSKNSSCEEFLAEISPDIAIISCGENNRYGHPHPETLERLEAAGSRICQTWEKGQICIYEKSGEWYLRYPCAQEPDSICHKVGTFWSE